MGIHVCICYYVRKHIIIKGYTVTHARTLYIYIYIYIYSHLQRDCFVVSQRTNVARHAGRFKLGSKPAQLNVKLSIIPLSHHSTYVSSGIIRHYVVATYIMRVFIRYHLVAIYIYICVCVCVCLPIYFVTDRMRYKVNFSRIQLIAFSFSKTGYRIKAKNSSLFYYLLINGKVYSCLSLDIGTQRKRNETCPYPLTITVALVPQIYIYVIK